LHFAILVFILFVPIPLLLIADPFGMSSADPSSWNFYVLEPAMGAADKAWLAWVTGTVLIAAGFCISFWSQSVAKKRYWPTELNHG
ncbi:MAG TPA: hypothetical protein VG820_01290, partial [Fimbriimonadaceae bacterium]|nr:hypothetical protein [Fimbriimonadaceae bacterium]